MGTGLGFQKTPRMGFPEGSAFSLTVSYRVSFSVVWVFVQGFIMDPVSGFAGLNAVSSI